MVDIQTDTADKMQMKKMTDKASIRKTREQDKRLSDIELSLQYVPRIIIKSDTGDPATGSAGLIVINTADNTIKIYAEGAFRTLATY